MRPLPYLMVALLYVLSLGGVILAVENTLDLDRGLLEDTRTPLPGSRVLRLEARKYNLFYEQETEVSRPPSLRVRIRPTAGDELLDLHDYSGSFTISGDREATAFATVRVPRAGHYRVTASGRPARSVERPAIVLGEPIGRRVIRIVAGGLAAVLLFLSGTVLLVATLVGRSRRRA